jgi:hypothetical protein
VQNPSRSVPSKRSPCQPPPPYSAQQCKFYILQTDRLWLRFNLVLCVRRSYAMGKRRFCSLEEFACNVSTWGAACKLFVAKRGLNLTLYSFEVPHTLVLWLLQCAGSRDRPLLANCNCAFGFEKWVRIRTKFALTCNACIIYESAETFSRYFKFKFCYFFYKA